MKFPVKHLAAQLKRIAASRPPDFIIGGADNPYLKRWWLIPRNRWFNIYLHHFLRSDADRALHDHPWWNMSLLLEGSYYEVVPGPRGEVMHYRSTGQIAFRRATALHRIKLLRAVTRDKQGSFQRGSEKPVWTLFITGPKIREWGFHCPKGWVHFAQFTKPGAEGEVGQGCE